MTNATAILDGSAVEPGSVGGKGFALNQLIGMGATVPPTGSITTEGYRWFLRDSGLQRFIDDLRREGLPDQADLVQAADRVDAAFLEAAMPDALAAQIRELAATVGGGLLRRPVPVVSRDRRRRRSSPRGETRVGFAVAARPANLSSSHRCAGR